MPDLATKLHYAARRYCIDRFQMWAERYAEVAKDGRDRNGMEYTDEALRTFPRYNVLEAIRVDIERLTGSDLGQIAEARETIALAGLTAQNDFTAPMGAIDESAMDEERQLYAEFIRTVSDSDIESTLELPYRRVVTDYETGRLRDQLSSVWGISEGYWYPLAEKTSDLIEAYQDRHFHQNIPADDLRQMLRSHGVQRLFEVREYGPCYELDVELFEAEYTGAEGFWISGDADWIIYASHESSITVGGWLLDEVQSAWNSHNQYVWRTPFFT